MITQSQPQPFGACALIFNPAGRLLLGKRKNSYKAGYYGLPGGRIELNEPITTAIQREVAEETGLDISNLEYVGVVRENQTEYDFLHFIFVAKNIDQSPALLEPEKCEGWEWIDPTNSDKDILPGHQAAISMYLQGKSLIDITS